MAGLEDGRTVLVELLMVLLLLLLIAAGAAAGELLPQLPDAVNVGAARCLGCESIGPGCSRRASVFTWTVRSRRADVS